MADDEVRRQSPPPSSRLDEGAEFIRDVLWLAGWGVRRLSETARSRSASGGLRGCLGFAASTVAVLFAASLLRRRRR